MTEDVDLTRYTQANREAWNEVMPLHQRAARARLDDAFQQPGHLELDPDALAALQRAGVQGKAVAHLCCNNGVELLSVRNLGAGRCVGFEISDLAIEEAQARARLCGIHCEYLRTDVYEIGPEYDGLFELVYVSAGALGWMPDLPRFLRRAAALLRPGGRVVIREIHPVVEMLPYDSLTELDPLKIREPYFKEDPYIDYGGLDYVGGTAYDSTHPQYWFVHTLGQIVTGLVEAGCAIEWLEEYPRDASGGHRRQEVSGIAMPLSYVLVAERRGPANSV
ncbi:MAG: class I SAM-dependent methyltransferase [Anaerolineae bacterium]